MSDSRADSLRDLAPGYALGALTPEEARAFEAALAQSPELQREVAELREAAALLALPDARPPHPALKSRLLARVREGPAPLHPVAAPSRPRRTLVPLGLGLALAASLLLALGLFRQNRSLSESLATSEQRLAERERRLAQREATLNALLEPAVQLTTLTATGAAPPIVQVFWNRSAHTLVVHTFQLTPAPGDRVYQLWLMRRHGPPIPSTLFNTEPTGHQLVEGIKVPADEEIAGFALTIEPAGGSPQPTTTPIVYGSTGTR